MGIVCYKCMGYMGRFPCAWVSPLGVSLGQVGLASSGFTPPPYVFASPSGSWVFLMRSGCGCRFTISKYSGVGLRLILLSVFFRRCPAVFAASAPAASSRWSGGLPRVEGGLLAAAPTAAVAPIAAVTRPRSPSDDDDCCRPLQLVQLGRRWGDGPAAAAADPLPPSIPRRGAPVDHGCPHPSSIPLYIFSIFSNNAQETP